MTRESDLLEAMAYATLPEQRQIMAELSEIQSARTASVQAERETDLGAEIVRDHLTPVFVHGMHTASTDWLDEVAPHYAEADIDHLQRTMRAEAADWFRSVHPAVRQDRGEFVAQAKGIAARTASQYGTLARQVEDSFMGHVANLYRLAEGTDLAHVPSAAGGETNPELDPWDSEPSTGAPADAGAYDNPEGIPEASVAPKPDGGSLDAEPSDSASGSHPRVDADSLLDVSDSNNAAGASQSEVAQKTSVADLTWEDKPSIWSQRARTFLATEEGQTPPTPGVVTPEQSGEAGSKLPREVSVTDGSDSMDQFITPKKEDAAAVSSERAPNLKGSKKASNQTGGWWGAGGDPFAKVAADSDSDDDPDDDAESDKDYPELKMDKTEDDESNSGGTHDKDGDAKSDDDSDDDSDNKPPWLKDKKASWSDTYDKMEKGKTCPACSGKDGTHRGDCSRLPGNHRSAVATTPNSAGSFVYDPQRVKDQGYKEGYRYALTWSPGRPAPAALTSTAEVGHGYNTEYVQGYREGVSAGVAGFSAEQKAAWSRALGTMQPITSARTAGSSDRVRGTNNDSFWDQAGYGHTDEERSHPDYPQDTPHDEMDDPWNQPVESSLHTADYKYIRERGGKYEIWQKGTGKTLSTHDSREKAEAAFRAMMQSKHSGSRETTNTSGAPNRRSAAGTAPDSSDHMNDIDKDLSDLDQTPSDPTEFVPTRDNGNDAADVSDVPNPATGYPQPSNVSASPAIGGGKEPVEPWNKKPSDPGNVTKNDGGVTVADPTKAAAFRARVQANLRRGKFA